MLRQIGGRGVDASGRNRSGGWNCLPRCPLTSQITAELVVLASLAARDRVAPQRMVLLAGVSVTVTGEPTQFWIGRETPVWELTPPMVATYRLIAVRELRDDHVDLVHAGERDAGVLHGGRHAADRHVQLREVRQRRGAADQLAGRHRGRGGTQAGGVKLKRFAGLGRKRRDRASEISGRRDVDAVGIMHGGGIFRVSSEERRRVVLQSRRAGRGAGLRW